LVIKWEQAKLDGKNKPEKKHKKIVATETYIDDEISVHLISVPKKKSQKKSINTPDQISKERKYQKKLKWLKDHRELTGKEGKNPGKECFDKEFLSN
jgi:hypothetical protein